MRIFLIKAAFGNTNDRQYKEKIIEADNVREAISKSMFPPDWIYEVIEQPHPDSAF